MTEPSGLPEATVGRRGMAVNPPTSTGTVAYSVIVVNWNVRELLGECIRSITRECRRPATDIQIIVVDNASSDGSAAMVRADFPDVLLLANLENVGFGQANNQALAHASGRVVVLLNPDTVVLDGALDALVDYLDANPAVGIAGCRLLNGDGTFQRWTGGAFPTVPRVASWATGAGRLLPGMPASSLFLDRDVTDELSVDWVSGACLAGRKEALGGELFDPHYFMYGEDMELCERVARGGWAVRYVPSISIVHFHGRSMAKQSETVLLSAIKGPRTFYCARNGTRYLWAYDLLLVFGFALRWVGFSFQALLVNTKGSVGKARTNLELMRRVIRVMSAP